MKIAIISPGVLPLPPVKGGAVENLIEHFIQENEKNRILELVIYSIDDSEARKKSKDYKYAEFKYINDKTIPYQISRACRYFIKRYLKLNVHNKFVHEVMKDLIKRDFDLVIIENKPEFSIPLSTVAKGKIIQHIHNDYLSLSSVRNHRILDASDMIIVVSEYIKKTLKWYEDQDKIVKLYNGIDTKLFSNERWKDEAIRFREKLGINKQDVVILYSGRITPQKGIKELINAFEMINNDNVKLLIVGASWYSKSKKDDFTKSLIKRAKNLNEKIIFTGYIDYNYMPIVYASADIAVVPSLGNEAAGLVVIEARAAGIVLIISDSGGLTEYADNKGIIINRDINYIESLYIELNKRIVSTNFRTKEAENSIVGIEKFDKKVYYNNFIGLLEDILIRGSNISKTNRQSLSRVCQLPIMYNYRGF